VYLIDNGADLADRLDRIVRVVLDRVDTPPDVLGSFGGFLGQLFDFIGNHRESLAGGACARRFNGRVEREQVGLLRDGGNYLQDLTDSRARLPERTHHGVG
jgi:hypothetical protein